MTFDPALWPAFFALGLATGFVAGLLGVGGGLIVVPLLIFLYLDAGIAPGQETQLALGTSLACILFTSASSVRAHHAHGAVDWTLVRRIAPGAVVGTLAGALIAAEIPGEVLKLFFVVFLFYAATQMWLDFKPAPHRELPARGATLAAGGVIGVVSSWVGIGGGTLSVPFMLWHNVPLRRAIATSAAVGFPIAAAGAVGYVVGGWGRAGLPADAWGYVHWSALAGIAAGSVLTAPLGARTTHRMPVARLKKVFALLLYALGLRMLVGLTGSA